MREIKCLDKQLELNGKMVTDVRYADDTTFISAVFEKLELAKSELEKTCAKWGLKINPNKCAVLISSADCHIEIDGNRVPNVDEFKFLGSIVPDCSKDIKSRISMASQAFGRLRSTIWSARQISRKLKIRLFKALILSIAIYGAETWSTTVADINSLKVFEMKCLRAIL